jgi:hypothetical protein
MEDLMNKYFIVALVCSAITASLALPTSAQQAESQMPMMGAGKQGQGMQGMMGGDQGQGMQGMMGQGPGGCPGMGGMGAGMHGMMGGSMMTDYGPRMEGRLAYVKAELGITDAQTSVWDAYASAIRARGETMQSMHKDMMQAMQSGSAMNRMDAHIKAMEAMVEKLKALKPATEALYAVLTDDQKKKADQLLGGGCGMM